MFSVHCILKAYTQWIAFHTLQGRPSPGNLSHNIQLSYVCLQRSKSLTKWLISYYVISDERDGGNGVRHKHICMGVWMEVNDVLKGL